MTGRSLRNAAPVPDGTSRFARRAACGLLGLATWLLLFGAAPPAEQARSADAAGEKPPASAAREPLPWLSDLDEAQRRARAGRRPLLVRVGADWCPNCRTLREEIARPDLRRELARWERVYLNVTAGPEPAEALGVAVVPTLRIRTPSGRAVADYRGKLEAAAVAAWLAAHYDRAAESPPDDLLATGRPAPETVERLVEQLGQRAAALREASIRRLASHPEASRAAVLQALAEGNLATRLGALEVLRTWKAPLEGVDPWHPATITPERLSALEQWADATEPTWPGEPEKLAPAQRAEARSQIERMLSASDEEARAVRERLARLGRALLPEVYERLRRSAADRDHERMLALRYRLVAGDSLVLRWPAGLERLAATDARTRQKAVEELAAMAVAEDGPLLLELFSDPDPLVREIALRGLREVGGQGAAESLVKLLDDPEPNVRAAVLKQLAEAPSPALAVKVAGYLEKEKDADLVVHGIRVLQASESPEALGALMAQLDHPVWQVRAEAAEAMSKSDVLSRLRYGQKSHSDLVVEAYVALIKLLDDEDAFVVSRAVAALAGADMEVVVEPLARAAENHPDLAEEIIGIFARANKMKAKALPHLRRLTRHERAGLRAAALAGLVRASGGAMEEELAAGLRDPDREVRVAAASSAFELLDQHRRSARNTMVQQARQDAVEEEAGVRLSRTVGREPEKKLSTRLVGALLGGLGVRKETEEASEPDEPVEPAPAPPEPDGPEAKTEKQARAKSFEERWEEWLAGHQAGENRLPWAERAIEPLERMLESGDPRQQVEAALCLVPLGRVEEGLAVLLRAVGRESDEAPRAAQVLPWLPSDRRLEAFDALRERLEKPEHLGALVRSLAEARDERAPDVFWKMLAEPDIDDSTADALLDGLREFVQRQESYMAAEARSARQRELAQAAEGMATRGTEMQRLAALALLAGLDREKAAQVASQLAEDATLGEALRRDAFQIVLATSGRVEADLRAVEALTGSDPARRKLALAHLTSSPVSYFYLRDRFGVYLEDESVGRSRGAGLPIIPEAPQGLKPEHVRPLLKHADPEVVARAGYLLALLHEPEGLSPLLDFWREQRIADEEIDRLVYRAIAALDDSSQVGVLREIYGRYDEYEVSEFYWTIRIMTGPEVLKLRKEIRAEVGMDRLR